jgi:hypothetical protein
MKVSQNKCLTLMRLLHFRKTLKQSLETPYEMRDEVEHEKSCKLWNEIRYPEDA